MKTYKQRLLKAELLDLVNCDCFGISGLWAPRATPTSCWRRPRHGCASSPKCWDPDTGDKGPSAVLCRGLKSSRFWLLSLLFPFRFLSSDSQIVATTVSGLNRSLHMSGEALCKSQLRRRLPVSSIGLFHFNTISQLVTGHVDIENSEDDLSRLNLALKMQYRQPE